MAEKLVGCNKHLIASGFESPKVKLKSLIIKRPFNHLRDLRFPVCGRLIRSFAKINY